MLGWVFIIVSVIGAVMALMALLFLMILFLAALFEKHQIKSFVPLTDTQLPDNAGFQELHRQTADLGLQYFGVFRDEESQLIHTRFALYFSDNGEVMLMVPTRPKLVGYRIMTRTTEGVWVITGDICSPDDLTGMIDTRNLPDCSLKTVMRYHLDRLAERPDTPMPFDPETIVHDLREKHREQARRSIDMGLAQWVSPMRDIWRYNARGAWRHVTDFMTSIPRLNEANRLAERYKAQDQGDQD